MCNAIGGKGHEPDQGCGCRTNGYWWTGSSNSFRLKVRVMSIRSMRLIHSVIFLAMILSRWVGYTYIAIVLTTSVEEVVMYPKTFQATAISANNRRHGGVAGLQVLLRAVVAWVVSRLILLEFAPGWALMWVGFFSRRIVMKLKLLHWA